MCLLEVCHAAMCHAAMCALEMRLHKMFLFEIRNVEICLTEKCHQLKCLGASLKVAFAFCFRFKVCLLIKMEEKRREKNSSLSFN